MISAITMMRIMTTATVPMKPDDDDDKSDVFVDSMASVMS